MGVKELDTVALETDVADHGFKKGDIGAVVQFVPQAGPAPQTPLNSGDDSFVW